MDKNLLELDIKDSDYKKFGEFVYKYIDILLNDKLPENEEKNIARTLLDYQQFFEYCFVRTVFELYRQVMYFCTNPELQNISIVMEIKDKLRDIETKDGFYQLVASNINNEVCQKEWTSALKFIYTDNDIPKEIPDEFLIENLIKDGYINVQDFMNKYVVDKTFIIYDV